jgi:phosphate transport system substrate-binding protein
MARWFRIVLIAAMCLMPATDVLARNMVQVKGSDTLINLVQRLAETYMQKNPGKIVAVTGGGSGTGIAALVNGKCDIANSSRLIKDKEIAQARERKIDPKRVVIAIDGLCVVTNAKNPIDKLTVDQLGKMFRGEIKNWKGVGGENRPVTLYGRQSNSGTYDFFMEHVLKGDYSPKMNQMNGNAQIVEAIRQDLSGIGYVGVGYVKDIKGVTVVKVAARAGGYFGSPMNQQDVDTGKYPLIRPLQQYINGMPKPMVRDFLAFELSKEGQEIVKQEGFFAIQPEYAKLNKALGL